MKEWVKILLSILLGLLIWAGIVYALYSGHSSVHTDIAEKKIKNLGLKIDSLENGNRDLTNELLKSEQKIDSISKLLIISRNKITYIKKQEHEKSDSIKSFNVDALSDFFSRIKTR